MPRPWREGSQFAAFYPSMWDAHTGVAFCLDAYERGWTHPHNATVYPPGAIEFIRSPQTWSIHGVFGKGQIV